MAASQQAPVPAHVVAMLSSTDRRRLRIRELVCRTLNDLRETLDPQDQRELDKAAVVAHDIQAILGNFDPLVYLPALFGRYAELLHGAFAEIEARWHDTGKAHAAFQQTLCGPLATDDPRRAQLWAKSARSGGRHARRHLRHELGSLLYWLAVQGYADDAASDLIGYLVLAHHGKVRTSLRAVPGEQEPSPPHTFGPRFARGFSASARTPIPAPARGMPPALRARRRSGTAPRNRCRPAPTGPCPAPAARRPRSWRP